MALQVFKVNSDSVIVNNAQTTLQVAPEGNTYYVDANDGVNTRSGVSWDNAFLTMDKAFDTIASGDTIIFRGKIREQLTTPQFVFDVNVIGAGNRPRHADSAPVGSNVATATWTTPASGAAAATPLCTVLQQGWRFQNILFAGPSDASCVQLKRTAEGANEYDASHASFYGCKFASGQNAIESHGGVSHIGIINNMFTSMTAAALLVTTGAGIGIPSNWQVIGNTFISIATILTAGGYVAWRIQNNTFQFDGAPTLVFDFTNGSKMFVVGNYFNIAVNDFDPAGGVTASGATDVWSNTLTNSVETGNPAN